MLKRPFKFLIYLTCSEPTSPIACSTWWSDRASPKPTQVRATTAARPLAKSLMEWDSVWHQFAERITLGRHSRLASSARAMRQPLSGH
jgi:hypothetical protein